MNEVKDRDIVLPGQLLGQKMRCEGACIQEGENNYALVKGLARVDRGNITVIPIDGAYIPKEGDVVIGVIDIDLGGVYSVDIKAAYKCILKPLREGGRGGPRGGGRDRRGGGGRNQGRPERRDEEEEMNFQVGDIISAKIAYVDEVKEAKLIGPRKLEPSCIIKVKPKRVPRIIGKQKSMIDLLRSYTNSSISVGQNGLVWIKNGNVQLAIDAIRKVEAEAQTSGLTDRMTEYLRSRSNKVK
jgi:exosome complex component RRP4